MIAILVIGFGSSGGADTHQSSTDSRAQGALTVARATPPENCPSVRKALRHYTERWQYWTGLMVGASKAEPGRIRQASRCPRYLVKIRRAKARAARKAYERWWHERGQVIRRLERGLSGTPMAGTGRILEFWGRRYGVSPYFMVAAAAAESSIGHAACANNRFNVWGLSSCGSGWYVPPFRSWDEAIGFYAKFLASRWPGHSTPYSFRGYAACSDCWGRKVSEWMHSLFGVAAVTRYP